MPISPTLLRFCLAHENAFLVPAECWGPQGIEHEFASALLATQRITEAQLTCLDAGSRRYFERSADLYRRAPDSWLAPRQTNLLIASDNHSVLPYLEPFAGTSSMLYVSDLDTDGEYIAYLIVHMERLALMRSARAAAICNLSYWFDRNAEERKAFANGADRAKRPDAGAFVALAKALRWVDELLHDPLHLPARKPEEPYVEVNDTGIFIPKRLQSKLANLADAFDVGARLAMEAHASVAQKNSPVRSLDALCDWLLAERPHAILLAPDGSTAWSPDTVDVGPVRAALEIADEDAIVSVHSDLRVIHERSVQFLHCVRDADSLPRECAVLEAGNGTYIDAGRRAVVHELVQPSFDARKWVAPPYHRLLLGARVMHEWGHIAHAAKMIAVPAEGKAAYGQARERLGDCFAAVLGRVPRQLRSLVDRETRDLAASPGDVPKALARKTLARVGDYLANLLSARLIPAEEMQAYVRTNVQHHLDERLGIIDSLARYAYEVQYLSLAGLPRDYFFCTSRFPDRFIKTGIVSESDTHALFDAVGEVIAHYAFDENLIALPATKN